MYSIPDESIMAKYLIKTHYIMKVVEFHPEDQTVDLIQDTFEFTNSVTGNFVLKNEFGNVTTATITTLDSVINVPVKQERWGQFEIQACPVPGDTGYIEVFTNDIRSWMEEGGPNIPWSDSHFLKTSCVFVPFVPNKKNAAQDYPEDNTKLVIKSKNASIVLTDSEVEGQEPVVDLTTTVQTLNINAEKGLTVKGDINSEGDITVKGNIAVDGEINATGNIKTSAEGDIIVGTLSLKNHIHATSQGPTGGPEAPPAA